MHIILLEYKCWKYGWWFSICGVNINNFHGYLFHIERDYDNIMWDLFYLRQFIKEYISGN